MKAIHYYKYGSPENLKTVEIETPTPERHEVLIEVIASGLNAADKITLSGKPLIVRPMIGGLFKPKGDNLGSDMAGKVVAIGNQVTKFKVGDEVFADLSSCGNGAFADYVCVPESVLAHKPTNISFEQAAATPMAAVTALQGLRLAQVQTGQKVLINGASGGVGSFAVQIAKAFGAEVTAVCSTRNLEMAKKLGADHVIDYTQSDFTESSERYDVILAANGFHPLANYQRALTPTGHLVVTGGRMRQIFATLLFGPRYSKKSEQKFSSLTAEANADDLSTIKEMIEAGKITPLIDQIHALDEIAAAFDYLNTGRASGKIVLQHKN